MCVRPGKNIFCASEKCSTTNPLLQKTEALTDEEDDSSELAGDQNDEVSEGSKVHSEHGRQGSSRGAGYTAVAVREEEEGSQPAVGSRRAKVKQDQQEQQQQSSSMSAKEYAAGTPWGIYFQHPVSLTLFASSFTYVRGVNHSASNSCSCECVFCASGVSLQLQSSAFGCTNPR